MTFSHRKTQMETPTTEPKRQTVITITYDAIPEHELNQMKAASMQFKQMVDMLGGGTMEVEVEHQGI